MFDSERYCTSYMSILKHYISPTLIPGQISHKVLKGHTVILMHKRVNTKTVSAGFDKKFFTNLQRHHHWMLSVAHSPYWS